LFNYIAKAFRTRCFSCSPAAHEVVGRVLGIVYCGITTHLTKKAKFSRRTAPTGAVILIQRFGTALSLKVRFQLLLLDGVVCRASGGFTALSLREGAEGW